MKVLSIFPVSLMTSPSADAMVFLAVCIVLVLGHSQKVSIWMCQMELYRL